LWVVAYEVRPQFTWEVGALGQRRAAGPEAGLHEPATATGCDARLPERLDTWAGIMTHGVGEAVRVLLVERACRHAHYACHHAWDGIGIVKRQFRVTMAISRYDVSAVIARHSLGSSQPAAPPARCRPPGAMARSHRALRRLSGPLPAELGSQLRRTHRRRPWRLRPGRNCGGHLKTICCGALQHSEICGAPGARALAGFSSADRLGAGGMEERARQAAWRYDGAKKPLKHISNTTQIVKNSAAPRELNMPLLSPARPAPGGGGREGSRHPHRHTRLKGVGGRRC
jgi:hypothetical protein